MNKLVLHFYTLEGKNPLCRLIEIPLGCKTIGHVSCQSHILGFRRHYVDYTYIEYRIETQDHSILEKGNIDRYGKPYFFPWEPEVKLVTETIEKEK